MRVLILIMVLSAVSGYFILRGFAMSNFERENCEFNKCIEDIMLQFAIPGMALAKINQGEIEFTKTFGFANVAKGVEVNEDTLFHVASISKPIMGLSLLQLVDNGLLDLDEDINSYLPFEVRNPLFKDEKITLRHLASHTSGIKDFHDPTTFIANKDPKISLHRHLHSMLSIGGEKYEGGSYFFKQPPGFFRSYSNLASGLAGLLVESVTQMPLSQYSDEFTLKPLGADRAFWRLNDTDFDNIAVPYELNVCLPDTEICTNGDNQKLNDFINEYVDFSPSNIRLIAYPHWGNPQYPEGGLRASIDSLAHLMVSILNNQKANGDTFLSPGTYAEMFHSQPNEKLDPRQRFFWREGRSGLIGHMGSDLGAFTAFYFDPHSKDGFIILINRSSDERLAAAMTLIAKLLA